MKALLLIALVACGSEPPPRTPAQHTIDNAPALTALQAGRFSDAAAQATTALDLDPHNAQAAAVRAIARYQGSGELMFNAAEKLMNEAEGLKAFDHETGRAAWQAFLDGLDAVDRDLATAAADKAVSLDLCLACWEHDWNHNGRIDDGDHHLFEIEFDAAGEPLPAGDPRRRPTFRFDVGDVDWARAMISFQRAAVELVLAYRWSELDKIFHGRGGDREITIHLIDPDRVKRARERIMAGVRFADRCRKEYLAETDDEREWVPNPRQKNHPVPLDVDDRLYETWGGVTADVYRLLASEEGISLRQLGAVIDRKLSLILPDAYLDLGAMLREPTDIVIHTDIDESRPSIERLLRGLFGHGYATGMRSSPLVQRLNRMKNELDHGDEKLERKLRYLFWLN